MALPLWVGFQSSHDLKSWYGTEEQDWVQLGEVLAVSALPGPMVFSVPRNQLDHTWQRLQEEKSQAMFGSARSFTFSLKRDDSTQMPVYEMGTASLKIMTIFSEFTDCVAEVCKGVGLKFISLRNWDQPGSFEMQASMPQCGNLGEALRVFGLLRGGIEVLSCVRGFQLIDLRLGDMQISGNLLSELERRLC
ncbi:MAG: hypothetical protein V4534_04400 [Myxococcota bacterium]